MRKGSGWTKKSELLLQGWNTTIKKAIEEHRERIPCKQRIDRTYTIFMNIQQFSLFGYLLNTVSFGFDPNTIIDLIIAAVVFTVIVAGIQGVYTVYQPGESYKEHLHAVKRYLRISREIELLLTLSKAKREPAGEKLKELSDEISEIMEDAPDIPMDREIDQISAKLSEPEPRRKKSTKSRRGSSDNQNQNYLQWQMERLENV